jgi:hypothetical protein
MQSAEQKPRFHLCASFDRTAEEVAAQSSEHGSEMHCMQSGGQARTYWSPSFFSLVKFIHVERIFNSMSQSAHSTSQFTLV